jgi:formyltetrahydrofolate synthetase
MVLTSEKTPAFVHAGPFGNIAHGNCSILADQMALKLADYVVTEAGFGSDLGAEKFFDIKCRVSGLRPDCAVIVCATRALKLHSGDYGGVAAAELSRRLLEPNAGALKKGFANLEKHIENVKKFGLPVVVAINRFKSDPPEELEAVRRLALDAGADEAEVSEVYSRGSEGGETLAKAVIRASEKENSFRFLYEESLSIREKIERIAKEMYGADGVRYSKLAEKRIAVFTARGYDCLPICMAKTHTSLTHDPRILGRPRGFILPIEDIRASVGAGFLYPLCGEIVTMPGLPGKAVGREMDIDVETGEIKGML